MHRPPLPPRQYSWYSFLLEAECGQNMSMKKSSHTIRNRTCDLPACSAVPQPTAPTHALDDSIITSGKCDGFVCEAQCNSGVVFCESGNDSSIMEESPGLDGDLQGFRNQLFQNSWHGVC